MTVAGILKDKGSRVVAAPPDDSVLAVARMLERERIGAVLVRGGDGAVLGVVSERDIVAGIARDGALALQQPIAALMTRQVIYCSPHDAIDDVMQQMTQRRFRHMPVVDDDGQLVGIVSIGDVVKHKIAAAELEAQSLKAWIASG